MTGDRPASRIPLWRGLFADPRHGRMPAILVILTVVTGVVDSVSILALGRVFVANMTGNVVFVGFAIAGAPGFSLSSSLSALAGFLCGALAGGAAIGRLAGRRTTLLRLATSAELALVIAALVIALAAGGTGRHLGAVTTGALAALLAVAMGAQNATARYLAVPDLTTTVLTMTLTGIAADLRSGKGAAALGRRLVAVGAMLVGAIGGALLVLQVNVTVAVAVAAGLIAVAAALAWTAPRRDEVAAPA